MRTFSIYLFTFCRLTGVYAFVIWLHASLLGVFSTAPQLGDAGSILDTREMCQNVWWKNLLYVGIYDFDRFGLNQRKYPKMAVSFSVNIYVI